MAMMSVYRGAIDASAKDSTQYIVERSLDICRTSDLKSVINYLTGGWELKGVCHNGTLYENWRISAAQCKADPYVYAVYQRICSIVGIDIALDNLHFMRISTQEYYDCADNVTVYMMVEVWQIDNAKPTTIYLTPKSRIITTPDGTKDNPFFDKGQEKAKSVLELLMVNSIKQDKEGLIKELRIEYGLDF